MHSGGKPPVIQGVIFDLDGLLVDSEPLAAAAMTQFLAEFGLQPDPCIQRQLLGRRLIDAMRICQEGYALPGSLEDLAARYGAMRLEAVKSAVRPLPGAREILDATRRAGWGMALATSGLREHATQSLEVTGLSGSFDVEVTGDDVSRGKPAPDLFLLAAERLGLAPDVLVVLEDSPLGVSAARAAGIAVIAVRGSRPSFPEFRDEPTVQVDTLVEAGAWLGLELDVAVAATAKETG